jgi:general secretion pathway protein G
MSVIAANQLPDDVSAVARGSSRPYGQTWPVASQFPIRKSQLGFTLIELLVVISMISLLAAMAIVQYRNSVQSGKEAVLKTNLFRMRDAIDQYYADKGKYPSSIDTLVSDGYLRGIPEDPITRSKDSWQTVPAEPDPSNPSAEPGIYDVKSGAQGTALDGSNYSDW